ncbi:HAMP domain-containing protein [Pendulispora rubella]|uniref:histidine kinase n=1 Tax=Pendulispora rubella TaxID=2741070 RepID=A0ABZ2KZS6_9BACT
MNVSIKSKLNAMLLALVAVMSAGSLFVYYFLTASIAPYDRIFDNLLLVSRMPALVSDVDREVDSYERAPRPETKARVELHLQELHRICDEARNNTPPSHLDSVSTIHGLEGLVRSLEEHTSLAIGYVDRQERTPALVESIELVDKIVDYSRRDVDAYVAEELQNLLPIRAAIVRNNRALSRGLQAAILIIAVASLLLGIWFVNRTIVRPLGEIISVSKKVAAGNLQQEIAVTERDEIGDLAFAFRGMQETITRLLRETESLFAAFRAGEMDMRGKEHGYSGSFRHLVLGINNVIDAVAARSDEARCANDALSSLNSELSAKNELLYSQMEERQRFQRERDAMHADLLATARKAGMAEIATGVLHNIGNALNSVNISSQVTSSLVAESKVKDVQRLAELLDAHQGDLGTFLTGDERGKLVPAFVRSLASALADEQARILAELGNLQGMVDHAKTVVTWQQNYAGVGGAVEEVAPSALVEDALMVARVEHDAAMSITVEKDYGSVPEVLVERHKVVQILVNLFSNARDAIQAAGREQGVVGIRLREIYENGRPGIAIEVSDNGDGIPSENMKDIFRYGYSTRQHGHGFGLHSCAFAAGELNGALTADSDGRDKGACFTLRLPARPRSFSGVAEKDGAVNTGA